MLRGELVRDHLYIIVCNDGPLLKWAMYQSESNSQGSLGPAPVSGVQRGCTGGVQSPGGDKSPVGRPDVADHTACQRGCSVVVNFLCKVTLMAPSSPSF